MNGEFKLFNDLMRSERFYKKDQRRVAAKVHNLWTSLHLVAAGNWDKNNKIYYKL